jgi:molecular chaperone HscB
MHFSKHADNYFELFGLKQQYPMDVAALEQTYFALQREFHPDKFVNAGGAEKLAIAQKSTTINDGYKVLKNALLRAEYLLFINDIIVNQDSKEGVQPCMILLAEAMEMRENLMESETLNEVQALENENETKRTDCVQRLTKAFADNDLDEATQLATRMKYNEKFVEEIRTKRLKLT